MNNRVNETTKNMLEFGVRVEQMDAALEDMKQTVDRNSRRGLEVQERKLDKMEFEAPSTRAPCKPRDQPVGHARQLCSIVGHRQLSGEVPAIQNLRHDF